MKMATHMFLADKILAALQLLRLMVRLVYLRDGVIILVDNTFDNPEKCPCWFIIDSVTLETEYNSHSDRYSVRKLR